jgi:uncharacterized protein (TIGR02145 family)
MFTPSSSYGDTALVMTLGGLSSNTRYYVRAVVRNATCYGGSGVDYKYSSVRTIRTAINCGSTLYDQDGNTYATTTIAGLCWMKSNLKATHYDNTLNYGATGNIITQKATGSSSNMSTTTPYYYYPNNSSSNVSSYGLLYNWPGATGYGVNNYYSNIYNMSNYQGKNQGACPRGWHIPTQTEMNTLNSNIESNYSSFSPQYAGYVSTSGTVSSWSTHDYCEYWSSTLSSGTSYYYWYYNNSNHNHGVSSESAAVAKSVRCVKDN